MFKRVAQREAQVVFEDQSDDALSGATQGEGIARACRLLVNREECSEAVELVSESDDDAVRRTRAGVVRAERLVVVGDRIGNLRILAVMERVIAAHDPL